MDKEEHLSAMKRSVMKELEINHILPESLTDDIHNRALLMTGINASTDYEGYSELRTEDL